MASRFHLLPSQYLIRIFQKISDLKCLFNCFCVCKLFARCVLEVQCVSFKIPYAIPSPLPVTVDPSWPPGIQGFLNKFGGSIKEANMEFTLVHGSPAATFWWKISSSGLVLLGASSMVAGDAPPAGPTTTEEEERRAFSGLMSQYTSDCKFRVLHMRPLLDIFPNIKKISGVDSSGCGKVVLDEEAINNLKTQQPSYPPDIEDLFKNTGYNTIRKLPAVRVPLSQYVLRGVILYIVNNRGFNDELMLDNCFQQIQYSEVAKMMLTWGRLVKRRPNVSGRKFYFVEN